MKDYIIVGFGISGLSLSKALADCGKEFTVISDASQQASRAAGGLVNPVMLNTGKLVWNIDEFLAFAKAFYTSFHQKVFTNYPIHRIFKSVEEQNNHLTHGNADNKKYVSSQLVNAYAGINAPFKMSQVDGGGVLNIQNVLDSEVKRLYEQQQFQFASFDFSQLQIHADHIIYDGLTAKRIIFAEGFGIYQNPFFKDLPIEGNKGEYLIIKAESLQLKAILKNKFFLIPLGDNLYKYGATYNRNEFSNTPSEEARKELQFHLDQMISCSYEIVDQVAGVRPTVKDKKPIYGTHSEYTNLYVCNGMGSRGLLMAPLLAKELIQHIEQGIPLRKEINLNRFTTA